MNYSIKSLLKAYSYLNIINNDKKIYRFFIKLLLVNID